MKIAFISDIHSNLEAFEAVLKDIKKKGISKIYCLGDIVGYNADPNECVKIVRDMKIPSVMGNHDFCAIDLEDIEWFNSYGQAVIRWQHQVLTKENIGFLKKLPKTMIKDGVFMVHGSPRDPLNEYIFEEELTDGDAKEFFGIAETPVIAMGHCHTPFVKKYLGKLIFNPGSVGQPRDGNPAASYAIFDSKERNVKIVRVKYNIKKAALKVEKNKLPQFLADRLFLGR